jgi:hypothetical protein
MNTQVNFHRVKAIEVDETHELSCGSFTKRIIITDTAGEELEITLYSKDADALEVKVEE